MSQLSTSQLLSAVRQPLARALKELSAHWREIGREWRARLEELAPQRDPALFAPLSFESEKKHLAAENFEAFRLAMERQGMALAGAGVPEPEAITALGLYLESCLPHLACQETPAGVSAKRDRPAQALARLTTAAQAFLIIGYATQRSADWRGLDDRERQRLSRDLHDEIGHNLVVLKLYMEMMAMDLQKGDIEHVRQKLDEALALVSQGVQSVRRLILDLGPAILEEVGFLPAVKLYSRQFTARTGIRIHLREAGLPSRLPPSFETVMYRVVQGALSNVVKHSHAKNVNITLGGVKDSVAIMVIEDDGVGFVVNQKASRQAFGLTTMRERIEGIGGRFHVESKPAGPGKHRSGTRIEVDLPLRGIER